MLRNIQALRAIAALLVVHAHATRELGLVFRGGTYGVDLFFVISGFIITYVASTESSQFLTRRLIRIVPTYWLATLALFALVLVMPTWFRTTSSDVGLLIRSLVFIPDSSNVRFDLPHPTLAGGWTLNYEMYFYVVFTIALWISRRNPTPIVIGVLGTVIAVSWLTSLHQLQLARFYGHPIVLEFIFGMLVFHFVRYTESHAPAQRSGQVQKWLLLTSVVAGLVLLVGLEEMLGGSDRWMTGGIPAFVVVGSAVMLERVYGYRITDKLLLRIGDASYVLYLTHVYVAVGTARLLIGNRKFSEFSGQLVVLGLIAVATAVAVAIHVYCEKPMLAYLKRRLIRPTPA